jgi:hypothetical protein
MSQLSDDAMSIITDNKTQFPLLEIKEIGSLMLWPVTKIQFEMFISETNRYGDSWYDEILRCNPRVSYYQVSKKNYEQLFITGLHIHEVLSFSKWFGEDFRIPTVEEWRKIYGLICTQSCINPPSGMYYQAHKIWQKLRKISTSPIKFSMMQNGVIEWVRIGENYTALGAPRPAIYPNTFNPLTDFIKKFNQNERLNLLGFRLIKGNNHD